jgi:hypothetical protein
MGNQKGIGHPCLSETPISQGRIQVPGLRNPQRQNHADTITQNYHYETALQNSGKQIPFTDFWNFPPANKSMSVSSSKNNNINGNSDLRIQTAVWRFSNEFLHEHTSNAKELNYKPKNSWKFPSALLTYLSTKIYSVTFQTTICAYSQLSEFQICSRNNCSASRLSIDKLHKVISVASNEQFSLRALMFTKVKATDHTLVEIRPWAF